MSLFICPECGNHSEIVESGHENFPHMCPHCGREFMIDRDLNLIIEE